MRSELRMADLSESVRMKRKMMVRMKMSRNRSFISAAQRKT